MKKKLVCFALIAVLMAGVVPVHALGPTHYTYTYNEWGTPIPSPDAYRVIMYIMGEQLYFDGDSLGSFSAPQDLQVFGNYLYLVDSGNNRIIKFLFDPDNATMEVVNVITHAYMGGEPTTFSNPHGLYISPWYGNYGEILLADTNNNRILHMDADWNVLVEILHPGYPRGASLITDDLDFLPEKVVLDFSGRMFAQVRHVNRGLMEFDRYGEFAGYMGAPPVSVSIWRQFWRMIASQEMRERMQLAVPVEYNNVTLDHEGFKFVTTTSEDVEPVRRLNAMGTDVMIRNGFDYPVGDLWYGQGGVISGPSQLIDTTALPNNTFVVFDRNRGRLFAYDSQGELLYAWGGFGNREGYFTLPTALESIGFTLFALDGSGNAALTVFGLTEYGLLVNQALYMYQRGLYEESYDKWNEVLRLNGNFGLAYIGLARALLRQGYYRDAMELFRLQNNRIGYGRAFGFHRRELMEEYFWMVAVAVGALMIIPPIVKKVIKVRREIRES